MHMDTREQVGFSFTVWFMGRIVRLDSKTLYQLMFQILEEVQISSLGFSLILKFLFLCMSEHLCIVGVQAPTEVRGMGLPFELELQQL